MNIFIDINEYINYKYASVEFDMSLTDFWNGVSETKESN